MSSIDKAKQRFDNLYSEIACRLAEIENEADTRFQIIDRILMEVLGWERTEIKMEPPTEKGFIDYLLCAEDRNRLVVEAKRTDTQLIDTVTRRSSNYKVSGSGLKSAQPGVRQAMGYCLETGVVFAALTTGIAWVGFLAIRSDGKAPSEGQALAFPSLEAIRDDFATFYDLFSREGVLEKRFVIQIARAEGGGVEPAINLAVAMSDSWVRLIPRSPMGVDLEKIFDRFFGAMSGDDDPEMLLECFVETNESRAADATFAKITRDLLGYVETLATTSGEQLVRELENAVESNTGEIVLIIGNKGAGKSTFIDRFFGQILHRALRRKCLVIRIDMADSSGDLNTIHTWITTRVLEEIERSFYRGHSPDYDELQGIFFRDYVRWSEGELQHLYQSDRTAFKIEFGRYMQQQVQTDKYGYVIRLLHHAIRGRQLLPCVVFDNTDQFSQQFQEEVFQYAQAIFRAVLSFVIVPVTDRTLWRLSKAGPLQSYTTKTFYLPVPPAREVLAKRVEFIKRKTDEEQKQRAEYFFARGIRLSIENIISFAACLEEMFVNNDYIGRRVSWLANLDIRRSLELTHRIVTSPSIAIEELVATYLSKRFVTIPRFKLGLALTLGGYNFFNGAESNYIDDVLSIRKDAVTSPLLKLSILRLLIDRANQGRDVADTYVPIEDIEAYLEPMGVTARTIDLAIEDLLKFRMVEPYDPNDDRVYSTQKIAIAYSGRMHMEMCVHDDIFMGQMALRTRLRSHDIAEEIRRLHGTRAWAKVISCFVHYLVDEDARFPASAKPSILPRAGAIKRGICCTLDRTRGGHGGNPRDARLIGR